MTFAVIKWSNYKCECDLHSVVIRHYNYKVIFLDRFLTSGVQHQIWPSSYPSTQHSA